jgi:hypothetical protein
MISLKDAKQTDVTAPTQRERVAALRRRSLRAALAEEARAEARQIAFVGRME